MLALAVASVARAQGPVVNRNEVAAWIEELRALESSDTGLSPTHSGLDFPPVAGQFTRGVALLSNAVPHQRSEALRKLVAAGPQALPLLLDHLDDKRETKLAVKHGGC